MRTLAIIVLASINMVLLVSVSLPLLRHDNTDVAVVAPETAATQTGSVVQDKAPPISVKVLPEVAFAKNATPYGDAQHLLYVGVEESNAAAPMDDNKTVADLKDAKDLEPVAELLPSTNRILGGPGDPDSEFISTPSTGSRLLIQFIREDTWNSGPSPNCQSRTPHGFRGDTSLTMVVRLVKQSTSKNLCRASLGALGYYLAATVPLMAAPEDMRTLAEQSAPVEAVDAAVMPGSASSTPATSTAPVDVEPPVPAPEEPSQSLIVIPAQDSLHYPINQWPVMAGQSPLFGTDRIAQFSEDEMMRSKWALRPHIGLSTVYDGNVFISNHGEKSDFIVNTSAGLTLRIGHPEAPIFLMADYTFGADIFLDHGSEDSIENSGYVNLILNFKKLTLGFEASAQSGSVTSIDVGDRIHQTNVNASANASYPIGQEITITASLTESASVYQSGFIDNEDTEFGAYFNYQIRPKITVGIGGGFGYVTVQGAQSQTAETISTRVLYALTEKVSISANFGAEFRQFGGGGGGDVQPVFGIGVSWAVRYGTRFELSAQRSIFASAILQNQDYVATGVSFSVTQRINDRMDASFAAGYENQSYEAAARDVLATRDDNYYYVRPGVQIHVAKRVDLNLYYEYSENLSSGAGADSFQRDRLGAQINLLF